MTTSFAGKILGIFGLTLLAVGITAAQETATPVPTPTTPPQPVEITCDPAVLLQQQSDLAAQLNALSLDSAPAAGESLDKLFKVGQAYQELALNCGYIPADAATRTVGTDVERILNMFDTVYGDPINGQLLYNGDFGCAGCHTGDAPVGPPTAGTYTRVDKERLSDPLLADYTVQQYLVESIINPAHYLVPGYQNVMINNFGDRLTLQDLADIVAYLESQDS